MKVFLDTNVLVSAFATRGLCADVVRTVLAEHELGTSEVVLLEFERVLTHRFGVPQKIVLEILDLLKDQHVVPKSEQPLDLAINDPDDLWVLASVIAAKADVFVTGDKEVLSLGNVAGIPITNPRGFWELLKS